MKLQSYTIIYSLILMLSLSSCIITDESLDDEILDQFEQDRGHSNPGEKDENTFNSNCKATILDDCMLKTECAFKIALDGISDGYKFLFSETALSETAVLNRMKKMEVVTEKSFNYAYTTYEATGKQMYLYVVGYSGENTYGDVVEKAFYRPASGSFSFNATVNISSIMVTNNKASWAVYSPNNPFYFCVYTDDEAEFANKLPSAALALMMQSTWKYHMRTPDSETMTYDVRNNNKILVVTRAATESSDLSTELSKKYFTF